jgi:hypothetical protein
MKNNFHTIRQVAFVLYNEDAPEESRWQIRSSMQKIPKNFAIAYVHEMNGPTIATSRRSPDLPERLERELAAWDRDTNLNSTTQDACGAVVEYNIPAPSEPPYPYTMHGR